MQLAFQKLAGSSAKWEGVNSHSSVPSSIYIPSSPRSSSPIACIVETSSGVPPCRYILGRPVSSPIVCIVEQSSPSLGRSSLSLYTQQWSSSILSHRVHRRAVLSLSRAFLLVVIYPAVVVQYPLPSLPSHPLQSFFVVCNSIMV